MEEKEELIYLYPLYLNNLCTAQELARFFELINSHKNDAEIMALMSSTWDDLEAVPASGLIPDFLPAQTATITPVRKLNRFLRPAIAAAAVLLVFTGIYMYKSDVLDLINPVQQISAISANSQRKQIQLADGTKVWLSPNSKLSYPEKFNKAQRLVSLDGEAFFEVAHDSKHPFIIQSGDVSTRVLGTSFNISAYATQPDIRVTLVTGKVAVALKTDGHTSEETITANQQVTINKTAEKITKTDFPDAGDFLNRRNGQFDYKGIQFKEVIKDLELQYHIRISILNELNNNVFYGNLDMTAPIDQTLNKLSTVMEINWKKDGGQYVITK